VVLRTEELLGPLIRPAVVLEAHHDPCGETWYRVEVAASFRRARKLVWASHAQLMG
jgi:hypothetical protein